MDYKEYNAYIVEQLTELRDLLIVIERGGDKSPDVLYKLAIEKSQQITECVVRWREEAAPEAVSVPAEYAEWLDGKTTEECETEEPVEVLPEITPEVEDSNIDPLPFDVEQENESADEDIALAESDEIEFVENEPDWVVEMENIDMEEDVPIAEFPVDEPIAEISWDDDEEEEESDEEFSDDELDEQSLYNMGEPVDSDDDSPITVGEMMSVRRAKELRRALSLNDRFRFRRELFGNSDVKMAETLALLDAMEDYAEASQYLTDDLGWDAKEPVVEEFLALVEKHFKSR